MTSLPIRAAIKRISRAACAILLVSSTAYSVAYAGLPYPAFQGGEGVKADLQSQADNQDWNYSGATGPQYWGQIAGFETCATGSMQSPIDIEGTEPALVASLDMAYGVTALSILNTGKGLTIPYEAGSHLHVGDKQFALLGLVMHTPSEHTVEGKVFEAEIQFLHQSIEGERAVVSVLVSQGAASRAFEEIARNLPLAAGEGRQMETVLINARDLVPFKSGYYRYKGSLTTPPCREGVNWYILKKPLFLSPEQIAVLRSVTGENNRPVQPRGNRILLDGEALH